MTEAICFALLHHQVSSRHILPSRRKSKQESGKHKGQKYWWILSASLQAAAEIHNSNSKKPRDDLHVHLPLNLSLNQNKVDFSLLTLSHEK